MKWQRCLLSPSELQLTLRLRSLLSRVRGMNSPDCISLVSIVHLVGVLRVDAHRRFRCTITHIAVAHRFRGQGFGQRLIEFIRDELNFEQAEAETDDDALGFYRACGFEIESLGESSFGTERFRCVICF